jgi:hypothetical protein
MFIYDVLKSWTQHKYVYSFFIKHTSIYEKYSNVFFVLFKISIIETQMS